MGRAVISADYVQLMARYNRWMNEMLYTAADRLPDEIRKADRGAFFRSIHSTLNHLIWGDAMWLGRFTKGTPLAKDYPQAAVGQDIYESWESLKAARRNMNDDIDAWSASITSTWLQSDFTWYSGITKSTRVKPGWVLASHFFNHQTHHRSQVGTLLMQQGIDPGVTDLAMMPD
ncbi:DinB family protein [Oxalobacteraceae bacterium R-40]|uniref:DinB family protein n=1 Tax=Keguizhuia sedimenti TaxID=3064264 RepID=A0ABU1BMR9_9BURK|nr:DinB family protein [Oxalobacteraceae bacterium R-40]